MPITARKKRIRPGEKVGLKLTQAERTLLLDEILLLPKEVKQAVHTTPPSGSVMLSFDELYDLKADPREERNVILDREHNSLVTNLRSELGTLVEWSIGL